MKIHVIATRLRNYNKWRKFNKYDYQQLMTRPDPKQVGITIEKAAKVLEKLYEFEVDKHTICGRVCRIADNADIPSDHRIDFGYIKKIAQATIKTLKEELEKDGNK